MCKGGVHLCSVYLFSQVGVAAKCSLDLLESIAFTLASLVGPWIIGGDWNCTPVDLQATGWLKKVGGVIRAPVAATCNGKVYDFFVVAAPIADAVNQGPAPNPSHTPAWAPPAAKRRARCHGRVSV